MVEPIFVFSRSALFEMCNQNNVQRNKVFHFDNHLSIFPKTAFLMQRNFYYSFNAVTIFFNALKPFLKRWNVFGFEQILYNSLLA